MRKAVSLCLYIIVFIAPCFSQNLDKFIRGLWGDQRGIAASGLSYYAFFDDSVYVYMDYYSKNKYEGSVGKWKIQGNGLFIQPELHIYWEKELEHDGPYYGPGENNRRYAIRNNAKNWIKIGDSIKEDGEWLIMKLRFLETGKTTNKQKDFYLLFATEDIEKHMPEYKYRYEDVEIRK